MAKKSNFIIEILVALSFFLGYFIFFYESSTQVNSNFDCNYFLKTNNIYRTEILNDAFSQSNNFDNYINFLENNYRDFEVILFDENQNRTLRGCSLENFKYKTYCYDFVSNSLNDSNQIDFVGIKFYGCIK